MDNKPAERQYGLWDSPFTPRNVASGLVFSDLAWDRDGTLAWREVRSGRGVLVLHSPDGQASRDLNSDLAVRAGVGYGGGDFTLGGGQAYFVEAESGRLYRQPIDAGRPRPISPAFGQAAAPTLSPDGRWLVFVHTYEGKDCLAILDAQGSHWPQRIAAGFDFYMQPCWHPSGQHLAWVAWDQPNMPWDGTLLQIGRLVLNEKALPSLEQVRTLAGGQDTSIFQPSFSPDGRYLAYVSDASGWWQIYTHDLETGESRQLTSGEADHGLPAWVQGMRTFDFSPDGKYIFFIRNRQGHASLWRYELAAGRERQVFLDEDYTWLEQIAIAPGEGAGEEVRLAMLASAGDIPPRVIVCAIPETQDANGALRVQTRILRRSASEEVGRESYAKPQPMTWRGMDGGQVYGLYYPPHNPGFQGRGRPPLIVSIHGGPTSQVRAAFNPRAQYFATRGYAYLEVNYRGSTGYGRSYWQALYGNWGVYDVQDAVSGARYLVEQGLADEAKLIIMGGSAGGFTVLQALVDHPGFFKAGVCLYGVANQFTLVAETHKFEARYSDKLLGPLPETAQVYRDRSPVFHADRIQDAVIIFQGEDDRVVPRSQSDEIVASLVRRGVPHEYHVYAGEGHGFRKVETLEHFYKTTEKFLRQHVIYT